MLINPELSFFGLRSHQNLRNLVVSSGMSGLFYVCKWICVYTSYTYMPWYHNISQQCEPWKFQSLVKPQLYSRNKIAIAFRSAQVKTISNHASNFEGPQSVASMGIPRFETELSTDLSNTKIIIRLPQLTQTPPIKTNLMIRIYVGWEDSRCLRFIDFSYAATNIPLTYQTTASP